RFLLFGRVTTAWPPSAVLQSCWRRDELIGRPSPRKHFPKIPHELCPCARKPACPDCLLASNGFLPTRGPTPCRSSSVWLDYPDARRRSRLPACRCECEGSQEHR